MKHAAGSAIGFAGIAGIGYGLWLLSPGLLFIGGGMWFMIIGYGMENIKGKKK